MNPNQHVVYQQRPCVVLDAKTEGYPLPENVFLLEEECVHSIGAGQVRHLAHFEDVDEAPDELPPTNTSA